MKIRITNTGQTGWVAVSNNDGSLCVALGAGQSVEAEARVELVEMLSDLRADGWDITILKP